MFTYLLINLLVIAVPLGLSFEKRVRFVRYWPALGPAVLISAAVFIVWDYFFTKWRVWGFHRAYLVGIDFFGLPLEEILFFFCIPYACLFIYEIVRASGWTGLSARLVRPVTLALSAGLMLTAALNPGKIYTSVTCLSLAALLLFQAFVLRTPFLAHFYLMYLISLLPMFLVNGVLTNGLAWIDPGPVVWYDDTQNLGIRLLGIPLDDFLYSMLLLLLNTGLYEYFKNVTRMSEAKK